MPQSPMLFGNLVESAFGRRALVLDIQAPAPDFLEIELCAEPPPGGWHPGHEVQFRVTPTLGRRYTVRTVTGIASIGLLISTTAGGPGTNFMRNLRTGTRTTIITGRHRPLRINGMRRMYIGDGCSLGALDAYARSDDAPVVVVEVPAPSLPSLTQRWPGYSFLPAENTPGQALQTWLEHRAGAGIRDTLDGALLLGHAQSIQHQRQMLTDTANLSRRAITTKPFWATGKNGL